MPRPVAAEVNPDAPTFLVELGWRSIEASIGEFTPTGTFVQAHALPASVSSLSGIGVDDSSGEAWVSGTGVVVW